MTAATKLKPYFLHSGDFENFDNKFAELIKCSNFTFLTFMLELVCRWQQFGRNEAYLELLLLLLLLEQAAGIIWVISSTAASHL